MNKLMVFLDYQICFSVVISDNKNKFQLLANCANISYRNTVYTYTEFR